MALVDGVTPAFVLFDTPMASTTSAVQARNLLRNINSMKRQLMQFT